MCVSRRPAYVHVFPGVGRLEDAVAGIEVAADIGLAGADVDDVWIRWRDGDRADRRGDARDLAVGDVRPTQAIVGALPNAAFDAAKIEEVRIAWNPCHCDGPAADIGADAAPLELAH